MVARDGGVIDVMQFVPLMLGSLIRFGVGRKPNPETVFEIFSWEMSGAGTWKPGRRSNNDARERIHQPIGGTGAL